MNDQVPEFLGRVVRSPFVNHAGTAGLTGRYEVWIANSKADVVAAVAHTQNRKLIVRSAMQGATVSDAVHAPGAVVLSLAHLNKIATKAGEIRAEAGATCGQMAAYLAESHLAIPLANNPHQSIASNVVNRRPSCLMRTLGPLSDYVSSLDVVTPGGTPTTLSGPAALAEAQARNAVVTEVAFKPAPTDDLWMIRKSFAYPGKEEFTALIKTLFLNANVPQRSDLVLDAYTAKHRIPVIRITGAGRGETDRAVVAAFIGNVITSCCPQLTEEQILSEYPTKEAVIGSLEEEALGVPLDSQIDAHRIEKVVETDADLAAYLDLVADDIDRGLAFKDDDTGKVDENLSLFLRYQLNCEGQIEISGFVYVRHQEPPRFVPHLARSGTSPFPTGLPSLAPATTSGPATSPAVGESIGTIVEEIGGAIQSGLAALESDALEGFGLPVWDQRIPNFKGEVYISSDFGYSTAAQQYATSSFPAADMTPFMVAYPRDEADIQAAIVFAKNNTKSIVARSGGHQYCGMSSGGSGTIVLSMDGFDSFTQISDNVVDVGPRTLLTDLAAQFNRLGITIPHGECPLVNIGGHAQTGGYGHFLRSFGLALDHVMAMTIVLADGSIRTVNRPQGNPVTDDDLLFWAVLGGNAGSFGVVTQYRIECVKDIDHPKSYGFAATREFNKTRYTNLMKEVQKWTKAVANNDPSMPPDVDFMMTVESQSFPLPAPVHLIELVYSNVGGPGQQFDPEQFFAPIISASNDGPQNWLLNSTTKGPKSLSALADSFVRRFPGTTWDGREFKYPYKKRVNSTVHELSDEFIDRFVDLIDKVVTQTEGVYLVFQMLVGGGDLRNSKRRPQTSIPRRDFVYSFVFDLFYDDGFKSTAEQLQAEMQKVVRTVYSPQQEERLFWGSFDDFHMSEQKVVNYYYDDLNTYSKLQDLKKKFDPTDLFHSPFSVQLPK